MESTGWLRCKGEQGRLGDFKKTGAQYLEIMDSYKHYKRMLFDMV